LARSGVSLSVGIKGEPMGEAQGKGPGAGRRTRIQGLSGVGAQPPNPPKGGWDYFLRESNEFLVSSAVHGAAPYDVQ